ncbi:hypothetical protein ON010_g19041 [Phytophthora cinnamomi]|nr:hypothetical protein ON010_g19041 [Phytophthora cinnamomi]
MPTLTTLPDLKSLQKLESFIVSDRGTWCCNGFLGECNLNNSFCTDDSFSGISAATCLPSDRPDLLATNATLAIIEKFNTTVCHVVETESGEQTTKVGGLGISFLEKRDGPDTNGGSPSDNGRGGPPPDTNSGLLPNTKGGPGGPPPGTNGNSGARAPETKSGDLALPTPETITPCGGILYRRCNLSGYEEAMCYNARFTAISCDSSSLAIEMRRRQIQKGVGDRCNPDYEAWLGCK